MERHLRSPRGMGLAPVAAVALVVLALATSACTTSEPPPTSTTSPPQLAEATGEVVLPSGDLDDCPAGFDDETDALEAGTHDGFASAGQDRSFHLWLPEPDDQAELPLPLFVSLTGTVQSETEFAAQSGLDQLPAEGWAVVAPVRNGNGLIWEPWDAMRTPDMTGPNPDEALVMELISCLSAHHAIDQDRIFVGGISIGGTFTNHLLRRHSDTFAGGIVGSGNFVLTEPAAPTELDPMTVIVAWGGETDVWTGCPDGRMGAEFAGEPGCVTAEFVADASTASQFYAAEPDVRQVACSADVGHIWIAEATPYWADLLADSPKGTTGPVDLGTPPDGLSCSEAAFVR